MMLVGRGGFVGRFLDLERVVWWWWWWWWGGDETFRMGFLVLVYYFFLPFGVLVLILIDLFFVVVLTYCVYYSLRFSLAVIKGGIIRDSFNGWVGS